MWPGPMPTVCCRSASVPTTAWVRRRELRSFLRRLVDQIEVIEPDGPAQWAASHFVSGVKHLPIRYRFR